MYRPGTGQHKVHICPHPSRIKPGQKVHTVYHHPDVDWTYTTCTGGRLPHESAPPALFARQCDRTRQSGSKWTQPAAWRHLPVLVEVSHLPTKYRLACNLCNLNLASWHVTPPAHWTRPQVQVQAAAPPSGQPARLPAFPIHDWISLLSQDR